MFDLGNGILLTSYIDKEFQIDLLALARMRPLTVSYYSVEPTI